MSAFNTSMQEFFNTVVKGVKDDAALKTLGSAWVDVRELANAHVLAAETPEASGERIIVSAGARSPFSRTCLMRAEADICVLRIRRLLLAGNRCVYWASGIAFSRLTLYPVDAANRISPPPLASIVKGNPGSTKGITHLIDYNTAKSDRILKLKHRPLEELIRDCLLDFKARGYAS